MDLTYEYRNYPVTYSVYVENEKKVQPKLWISSAKTCFRDAFGGFSSPFGYRAAFGAHCSTFRYREELVICQKNQRTHSTMFRKFMFQKYFLGVLKDI